MQHLLVADKWRSVKILGNFFVTLLIESLLAQVLQLFSCAPHFFTIECHPLAARKWKLLCLAPLTKSNFSYFFLSFHPIKESAFEVKKTELRTKLYVPVLIEGI